MNTRSANSTVPSIGRSPSFALLIASLLGLTVFAHPPGITERASVSSDEAQGDNSSSLPDISADGRFVAFWSLAANLVPGDTNDTDDVFVHDRLTGATERVSVDSRGRQKAADGNLDLNFGAPAISADGRFVAFASSASTLVSHDTNNTEDVFVHDRQTGATERISVTSQGRETFAGGFLPAISGDGRFVAFVSTSDELVPGDTNGQSDVFVHDRSTGNIEIVSVSSAEEIGNNASGGVSLSFDGRFVALSSAASNLVPGDTNVCFEFGFPFDCHDVFVRELIDKLSADVRFLSATPTVGSCVEANGTITCDLGSLNNGQNATVVRAGRAGIISNTARVSSRAPDPDRTNNTDTEQTTITPR